MKKLLQVCLALIAFCGFQVSAQTQTPPQISSGTSEFWYLLQATRPAGPTYLTSTGTGARISSSVPFTVGNNSQLWKFVRIGNGDDSLALVNKATGEYLDADAANNTVISTKSAVPTLTLALRQSDTQVDNVFRFWVENTGATSESATFRLHASGSGQNFSAMNWTGNATDNSDW